MDLEGLTCIDITLGFYAQWSDNSLKKAITSIDTKKVLMIVIILQTISLL